MEVHVSPNVYIFLAVYIV